MKSFLSRFSLFVILSMLPAMALAETYVIGLSPYQEAKAAEVQVKSLLQFLTTTLEPGDSAMLFDAWHIQTLGHFVVPNKSAYRHPKAKLKANTKAVRALLQFAAQARMPKGRKEPSITGAICWPQFLRFIGENFPASKGSDLILLGNPLFEDPKETRFAMRGRLVPGDGHLIHARSATPYGIKGQGNLAGELESPFRLSGFELEKR